MLGSAVNICIFIAHTVLGSLPDVGWDYFIPPTNWATGYLDQIQDRFKHLYVVHWSLTAAAVLISLLLGKYIYTSEQSQYFI